MAGTKDSYDFLNQRNPVPFGGGSKLKEYETGILHFGKERKGFLQESFWGGFRLKERQKECAAQRNKYASIGGRETVRKCGFFGIQLPSDPPPGQQQNKGIVPFWGRERYICFYVFMLRWGFGYSIPTDYQGVKSFFEITYVTLLIFPAVNRICPILLHHVTIASVPGS